MRQNGRRVDISSPLGGEASRLGWIDVGRQGQSSGCRIVTLDRQMDALRPFWRDVSIYRSHDTGRHRPCRARDLECRFENLLDLMRHFRYNRWNAFINTFDTPVLLFVHYHSNCKSNAKCFVVFFLFRGFVFNNFFSADSVCKLYVGRYMGATISVVYIYIFIHHRFAGACCSFSRVASAAVEC